MNRGPRGRGGDPPSGGRLSIGALSRSTGIPVETLRTWERRYGFPVPERKPSGHRVYPVSSVARLRRIAEALGRGHRPAEVVSAPEGDLAALLGATPTSPSPPRPPEGEQASALPALLQLVAAFDAERLTRRLMIDWARLGPLEFLRSRVAPLIRAVGDAWESGRFEVRHEHFLAERVGDLLRTLRLPFEEQATGPLLVLATLPGEAHGLGLQMAALLLGTAGCRILYLGTETPVPDIAALARDLRAVVAAVSVSSASRGAATGALLARLREGLPRRTLLLVGGEGAPKSRAGLVVIRELGSLDAWGRQLVATGRPPLPTSDGSRGAEGRRRRAK